MQPSVSTVSVPMTAAPRRVEIPRFPGDKRIAFTSSWDDGPADDRRLVALFNRLNLPGTFNLIGGSLHQVGSSEFISAAEARSLYAGHEVGIHTTTHPFLPDLDASQIAQEILDDRRVLEDIVEYPVRGMAYPYGGYTPQVQSVLRGLGITYARTVEMRDPCFPPPDALAWAPTCHVHGEWPAPLPKRWDNFYNNPGSRGVFCLWGHSFEITQHNGWEQFKQTLTGIANRRDVWYCTNINVFDYEAARSRIVIAANRRTAYNPSGIPVTLKVDGKLIDIAAGQMISLVKPQRLTAAA